jgi:Spy/CpxP family protein refolding chaperone
MKYTLTAVLTLIATLAIGTASAVDVAALARAGLIAPETITAHHESLDLSPEQEARLKQIHEEMQAQAEPLEQTVAEQQKKLETLMRDETITAEAAEPALKALLDAEAAVKALQLRTLIQLRVELTPEQRTRAIEFARADALDRLPLEARVQLKARRLRAAFDEIGVTPPDSLKARGAEIEAQLAAGDFAGADTALDELIEETGLEEPAEDTPVDFSAQDPGATDLETLKVRLQSVESEAVTIIRLPVLRQLVKAKDALEAAKAAEDAIQVGRILTFAEGVLK